MLDYIGYFIIAAIVTGLIIAALIGRRKDQKTGFKPSTEEEAHTRERAERDFNYAAHYGGPGQPGVINPPKKNVPSSPHFPEDR